MCGTTAASATLLGAVLHLRGPTLTPQPLRAPSGSALLWNGEVFQADGHELGEQQSDTVLVLDRLEAATVRAHGPGPEAGARVGAGEDCQGPPATVKRMKTESQAEGRTGTPGRTDAEAEAVRDSLSGT